MADESSTEVSSELTIVVMKDHLNARTFRVPIVWISRLGLVLGVLIGLTLLSTGSAIRNYWIARKSDPFRVLELENEIQELQNKINLLQSSNTGSNAKILTESPTTNLPSSEASPAPVAQSATTIPNSGVTESLLGGDLVIPPDANANLPYRIESARSVWKGNRLETLFHFIYTKTDGQTQKGRFIILARGPKKIISYPENAIQVSGQTVQIRPGEGEYFSVGKFREATAEFVRPGDTTDITQVEVLIYDRNQKLMQQLKLNPTVSGSGPSSSRKSGGKKKTTTPATEEGATTTGTNPAATTVPTTNAPANSNAPTSPETSPAAAATPSTPAGP